MDPDATNLAGLTLTQLAYVVAVDSHRHFGLAAAACNVTQPTLSMQIAKLERALGVTLFERSRTPVVPTELGVTVAARARAVLREAALIAGVGDGEARVGEVAGELRIGVIPTVAPYLLPRAVHELSRRHPRLALVIEERVTDEVVEGLRRETLDAGLIASPSGAPDTVERVLFTEPFVAYVGDGHRLAGRSRVAVRDLSLDDLWLLSEGHCLRAQTVRLCGQRSARRVRARRVGADAACTSVARFESGNLETLKRLVERGMGMTLLPALAAAELGSEEQRRLLRPFASPAPSRDVRLVQRRAHRKQALVDAVVEALLRALPPELRTAGPPPGSARRKRAADRG